MSASSPRFTMMRSFSEAHKVGSSVIYGRADDMNRIVELLNLADGSNCNSSVVSIIADRGTGRTTMLHLLHSELGNTFDTIKFVSMPEKYGEKGLMKVIIESLTEIPCDITDPEVLKETLEEEIKDNKLLLLLDDFENKSPKCWDLLIYLLTVCKNKSAIVVTATQEAVAKVNGPIRFYYMNNLSNEWCWEVFKQGVFSGEDLNADAELPDIGKLLVAKCNNVTLCIKVLSGLLRYSISDDWWRAVLESNFWEMDEVDGKIQPALRVCYEYLPSHLKQCFKYCSLFPKEYIFSKEHLVRFWLSQGFIEPADGRELEDIGAEYFDHFLSLSFFQPSFFPGETKDRFVMTRLIHDLALRFSKNECFQFERCVQRAPENASHLSLVPHEFQSISLSQIIPRDQNLLTLSVVSRSAFHNQSISCSIINLVDLKNLIGKFHSLITLDLNNSDIEELPESFGSLTNLRYLSVNSTRIKKIPLEISNLIYLQTLEAKDCYYLEELPRSIEALTNLRYLDVTKQAGYVVMPRGIGKLTHLRSLATFNVGKDALVHCGIEELKDMVLLKGCLEISGLLNVRSASDVNQAHIQSKEYIETFCFNWSDGMSFLEGDGYAEIAEEVLESLHPTDNLKEIIIRDYPGSSFPKWIECAAFTSLISIIFDHCYNCERLPALGALPSLKFLTIRQMYFVERMNLSGSDNIPDNIIRYPSLEQLSIWEMYELVEWVELENGSFPVLHSLSINRCPFLRNIPKFPALVELSVYSCEHKAESSVYCCAHKGELSVYSCAQFVEEMELPSLQSLKIQGLQKTESVRLSKNLVELMKLKISHCPELLSIKGLSLLNSLKTIAVFGCPKFYPGDIYTSLSSQKEPISTDKSQQHPIIFKRREDEEQLCSLSKVLKSDHQRSQELTIDDEKDLKKLRHNLLQIQAIVSAAEALKDIDNHQAKILRKIKNAIYDAEDVIDEYDYQQLANHTPSSVKKIPYRFFNADYLKKRLLEAIADLEQAHHHAKTYIKVAEIQKTASAVAIGWAVSPFFSFIVNKTLDCLKKPLKRTYGMEADVEKLEQILLEVQSVMPNAEKLKDVANPAQMHLLHRMKEAVHDAEDVMDEFNHRLLEAEAAKEDNVTEKFGAMVPTAGKRLVGADLLPTSLSKAIKSLERVDQTANAFIRAFNLMNVADQGQSSGPQQAPTANSRVTTSIARDEKIVGRDADINKIVATIKAQPDCSSAAPLVISVFGVGGIGKTTLAQWVYNHQEIASDVFHVKMWVSVANTFDHDTVTRQVLAEIKKKNIDCDSLDTVQEEIIELLGSKKFLLILDDVWADENKFNNRETWEKFFSTFKRCKGGSTIIVTTRLASVVNMIENCTPFHLEGLLMEDSEDLFMSHAFPEGVGKTTKLEAIGKDIVKKLKGVPLALKVVGRQLRGNDSIEYWKIVLRDTLSAAGNVMDVE